MSETKSANWYKRRKLIREQLLKNYTESRKSEIAETHQRLVEEGRLYTENYNVRLEDGYIGPPGFETVTALSWTGDQKERFFELLGRKSKSEIEYIATQINKPAAQCLAYIEHLESLVKKHQNGDEKLEFPEAEEADPDELETSGYEVTEQEQQKLFDGVDYDDPEVCKAAKLSAKLAKKDSKPAGKILCDKHCLLDCRKVKSKYSIDKDELQLIIKILATKIRQWVLHFMCKSTCGHAIFHDDLEIKYIMDRNPGLFYGDILTSYKNIGEMARALELTQPQISDATIVDSGTDLGTEMQSSDTDAESSEVSTKRAKRQCVRSQNAES